MYHNLENHWNQLFLFGVNGPRDGWENRVEARVVGGFGVRGTMWCAGLFASARGWGNARVGNPAVPIITRKTEIGAQALILLMNTTNWSVCLGIATKPRTFMELTY
jgi:hypothetical protein